ncbi:acyl-CoA dehydrogenase [Acidobacteriota bacterium]
MKFELSEEHKLIRDTVRDFMVNEVAPKVAAYDESGEFPHENIKKLAELGLTGMIIPEEYGGAGTDTVSYCLAIEEMARVCPSTAITVSVNTSVFCEPVYRFGTDALKKNYLVPCARGEAIGGFALTEPGAGSDAGSIKVRAEKKGKDYIINGAKAWVTNAIVGKYFVVMAVTDPEKGKKGLSAFVVDADSRGFRFGPPENKMGIRASKTSQIIFEDCAVPAENLLGGEGMGLQVALGSLEASRVSVASQAVGIAQGCLDEAIKYAKEREQFGKTIAHFQAIQFMIADMATEIDAARLLTLRAACLRDRGVTGYGKESSMAKLFASEACNRVAYKALQIHGSYGYSKEYTIERLYRDARVVPIYEGTSEVQRIVISRDLLKA